MDEFDGCLMYPVSHKTLKSGYDMVPGLEASLQCDLLVYGNFPHYKLEALF